MQETLLKNGRQYRSHPVLTWSNINQLPHSPWIKEKIKRPGRKTVQGLQDGDEKGQGLSASGHSFRGNICAQS